MHIRFPKAIRHAAKAALGAVERANEAQAKGQPSLLGDAFEVANTAFKQLTSEPNHDLVARELKLAAKAVDPKRSQAERGAARSELRRLMGAAPGPARDALPPGCSAADEATRAARAQPWDPARDPTGQWASSDRAGKRRSDPINLYVHGSLADVVRAFQQGGWSIADARNAQGDQNYERAIAQYAAESGAARLGRGAGVSQATYHQVNRMPVSTLYLNGQPQLLGMQANNHPLTGRDHFRIYWTGKKDAEGRNVYAIAASRDAGLKLDPKRQQTAFTNHFTEHNADLERDFALKTLLASGASAQVRELPRTYGAGPQGGLFSQDGKALDITLG